MPTQEGLWLDDEERLLPCPNSPCYEHKEDAIRLRACWPFHLPLEMISCCRKSAFSAMSSDLLLARSASVPRGKEEVSGVVQ